MIFICVNSRCPEYQIDKTAISELPTNEAVICGGCGATVVEKTDPPERSH